MADLFQVSVKCLAGCEAILAEEMKTIGAQKITLGIRVVQAEVDMEWVYRANLCLRTAMRILIPIKKFRAKTPEILYHKCKKVRWEEMFGLDQTFAIDCTAHSSYFSHSKFASLKMKDAIADRFRMSFGSRPNVDPALPNYRFNLHIQEEQCTISIDTSARSLHMRGYRIRQGEAPMSEVLAASILKISGWTPEEPLINPMCGSGTFMIEAALMAENKSPQYNEEFGFKRWGDYSPELWDKAQQYAKDNERDQPFEIIGSDRDMRAIQNTRMNLDMAGYLNCVEFRKENFFMSSYNDLNGHVFLNPPYDIRLKDENVADMYRQIGDTLKQHYSGNTVWIITGNREAAKSIGLRTSMKKQLWNGPIECRLLKFEMYRGKKDA